MTQDARTYARIRRGLWFLELGLTLGFLFFWTVSGLGPLWRDWVQARVSGWPLQVAVYSGLLWLVFALAAFPLAWYRGYRLEHRFGLSTQGLASWFKDVAKGLALSALFGGILVEGLSLLLRLSPSRWWIWAAGAWLAWTVLLAWIFPTWLLPIFYRQTPLAHPTLLRRLEQLLERCGTRVRGIFEVNLSRTTRKANACLCGMGHSRRVLVSDTLVSRYPPEEVEVVLAHELGHHRLHHMRIGIALQTAAATLGCFLVDRAARAWMGPLRLTGLDDLAALPLLGLGLSLVDLALLPATRGLSRRLEAQADRFALEKTCNPQAFIATMRRLAEQNLAEVDPPRWAEWLLYDHPSIRRRMAMAEQTIADSGQRTADRRTVR